MDPIMAFLGSCRPQGHLDGGLDYGRLLKVLEAQHKLMMDIAEKSCSVARCTNSLEYANEFEDERRKAMAKLEAKIANLQATTRINQARKKADLKNLTAKLAPLKTKVEAAEKAVAAHKARLATLQGELATLEAQMRKKQSKVDAFFAKAAAKTAQEDAKASGKKGATKAATPAQAPAHRDEPTPVKPTAPATQSKSEVTCQASQEDTPVGKAVDGAVLQSSVEPVVDTPKQDTCLAPPNLNEATSTPVVKPAAPATTPQEPLFAVCAKKEDRTSPTISPAPLATETQEPKAKVPLPSASAKKPANAKKVESALKLLQTKIDNKKSHITEVEAERATVQAYVAKAKAVWSKHKGTLDRIMASGNNPARKASAASRVKPKVETSLQALQEAKQDLEPLDAKLATAHAALAKLLAKQQQLTQMLAEVSQVSSCQAEEIAPAITVDFETAVAEKACDTLEPTPADTANSPKEPSENSLIQAYYPTCPVESCSDIASVTFNGDLDSQDSISSIGSVASGSEGGSAEPSADFAPGSDLSSSSSTSSITDSLNSDCESCDEGAPAATTPPAISAVALSTTILAASPVRSSSLNPHAAKFVPQVACSTACSTGATGSRLRPDAPAFFPGFKSVVQVPRCASAVGSPAPAPVSSTGCKPSRPLRATAPAFKPASAVCINL